MKLLHNVLISVFITPEDHALDDGIDDKIIACIKSIVPIDLDNEKLSINKEIVTGFNNRDITIYRLILAKESHTNIFIKNLCQRLNNDQKELLLRQSESRLDENLDFFIRLGKQELLRNDIYITDSGDCFHIKIGIAAFPKNKQSALKVINNIFS